MIVDSVVGGNGRGGGRGSLGHTGASDRRRTHLGQNLVQPLQRPIEVQLDPARSACNRLSSTEGEKERERDR